MSFSNCLRFVTLFILLLAAMYAMPHHLVRADRRPSNYRKLGRVPPGPVTPPPPKQAPRLHARSDSPPPSISPSISEPV
ncbi:hypothetical protein TorRG33x02_316270 [Trema orientale]|uniref:Transmembrane protein n=1 Tax=Trema orientale TaxID=63057 RepID=A0A2P5BLW2_TREOI|nr:hypothetical protein TorRG33x02_316270 [Trema orientale]